VTESVLTKIRKLLELSKSSNEHEAATAAARAAELMLKHEIEEADLEAAKPQAEQVVHPVVDEVIDENRRKVAWKFYILTALARAFGGDVYSWKYTDRIEKRVIAPAPAMQAIRYMYSYLTGEIDRLANTAYATEHAECKASGVEAPSARAWKSAFRVGAATVIYNRLSEQRSQAHSVAKAAGKSQALAVINRQADALDTFKRTKHRWMFTKSGKERSWSSSSTAGRSSSSGYEAGQSAGRSVSLGGGKQLGSGSRCLGGDGS
jgi:hypothetical protein